MKKENNRQHYQGFEKMFLELNRIFDYIYSDLPPMIEKEELTQKHICVLEALAKAKNTRLRMGELVQEVKDIDASLMCRIVERLNVKELVNRERGHDRRKLFVTLTSQGHKIIKLKTNHRNAKYQELLDFIDDAELKIVQKVVETVADYIDRK